MAIKYESTSKQLNGKGIALIVLYSVLTAGLYLTISLIINFPILRLNSLGFNLPLSWPLLPKFAYNEVVTESTMNIRFNFDRGETREPSPPEDRRPSLFSRLFRSSHDEQPTQPNNQDDISGTRNETEVVESSSGTENEDNSQASPPSFFSGLFSYFTSGSDTRSSETLEDNQPQISENLGNHGQTSEPTSPGEGRNEDNYNLFERLPVEERERFIREIKEIVKCPLTLNTTHTHSVLLESGQTVSQEGYRILVAEDNNEFNCPISRQVCHRNETRENIPINNVLEWLNQNQEGSNIDSLYQTFSSERSAVRSDQDEESQINQNIMLKQVCEYLNTFETDYIHNTLRDYTPTNVRF